MRDEKNKMSQGKCRKVYVDVVAEFTPEGRMSPLLLVWEDGTKYRVDAVTDCRRAASLKAGGTGWRYTCRICGGEHFLYYEENGKWFVEAKG